MLRAGRHLWTTTIEIHGRETSPRDKQVTTLPRAILKPTRKSSSTQPFIMGRMGDSFVYCHSARLIWTVTVGNRFSSGSWLVHGAEIGTHRGEINSIFNGSLFWAWIIDGTFEGLIGEIDGVQCLMVQTWAQTSAWHITRQCSDSLFVMRRLCPLSVIVGTMSLLLLSWLQTAIRSAQQQPNRILSKGNKRKAMV
jgi:hypothetical protein